jgi:hypothetical protein
MVNYITNCSRDLHLMNETPTDFKLSQWLITVVNYVSRLLHYGCGHYLKCTGLPHHQGQSVEGE